MQEHLPAANFLVIEDLCFSYGKKESIITDFSLTVARENFVAVIGPNGSGKTTLLKLLAGILRPVSGYLEILGRPVRENTDPSKILAYVPQSLSPGFSLTVLDFVLLGIQSGGGLFGKISRRHVEKAREALALLGMEKYENRDMLKLSGGERQKIILTKALAQDTPLVLLDEPITYLDLCGQLEILELLKKMSLEGKKVIAVMHDINFAARYSDYAVIMKAGRLFAAGKTADAINPDTLERCFSVRIAKNMDSFVPVKAI